MSTSPPLTIKPITVSIVSHGHLSLILVLLDQLDALNHSVIEKVILTINTPEPDVLAGMRWGFPVERISNIAAQGFGANHNQAFAKCETPWFLVLNPDIRLTSDVLTPLIDAALPRSGILTPRILEPEKGAPEQHRRTITPWEILARKRKNYKPPHKPNWIPGLFMLFRSETFRQINGFDERFFMYGEDFDISARAQLAGWKLQVSEKLLALHEARRASHVSAKHFYWHSTSLLKVWASPAFWRLRRHLSRTGNTS